MTVTKQTLDLIKKWEGFRDKAYLCPARKWTIGYGFTTVNGKPVKQGDTMTREVADKLLIRKAEEFQAGVLSLVKVPVTPNQLSALVSFAFNCGLDIDADAIAEGLGDSTLLKKLNAKDYNGAAAEFPKWNKVNGVAVAGLTNRRKEEKALFLKK